MPNEAILRRSSDNGGAALIRMSAALVKNHYPVLRITCDMVINANTGNGPAQWTRLIQQGTKPQDIIYKNAVPSYDSVGKSVDAGSKYIFQMITGANHEDSRINANHNPLLAKWAFSKVKGGTTGIPFVPISSKRSQPLSQKYSTFLTFAKPVNMATGPIFTVLGQTCRGNGTSGVNTILIRRVYSTMLISKSKQARIVRISVCLR